MLAKNPDLCLTIFSLRVKMAYYLFLTYTLEFLFPCHEQELTSFYNSFDQHWMF